MVVGSMATVAAIQATYLATAVTQSKTSATSSKLPDSVSFLHAWSVSKLSNVSSRTSFQLKRRAAKVAKGAGVAFARSSGQQTEERSVKIRFEDDARITSEPFGEKQLKVSVNLTSNGTRKAFDYVLENLRRSAPPVQGFRKTKGGKSMVSREVLYQMLGPSRVNSFVVEEMISSSVLEYLEKEGFKVKKDFKTLQSNKEMAESFKAGKEFVFDAILDLEDKASDASTDEESQNE